MKSGVVTIFKKELARFFGDRRMILTTILLPGILIYLMYQFIGSALMTQYSVEDEYRAGIVAVNAPDALNGVLDEKKFSVEWGEMGALEQYQTALSEETLDLCIVFPEQFGQDIAGYDPASGAPAPNIAIYYNSTSTKSETAYRVVLELLNQYESTMANKFDVNAGNATYDMATDQDIAGSIFSSMLPMLLLVFLFSGCMSVATESIAGEKERGTIATLLVTPVRREEIALGKIFALAIVALLSGLSSTIGTVLSLPALMGATSEAISVEYYTMSDYVMLGVVILTTVILLVTLISLLSAMAKTIKEAQTLVMPLMIVVILVGITGMFGGGAPDAWYYYLIPVYNSVQSMVGILSFSVMPVNIVVAAVSNLLYGVIGALILARMFNSEKIMFSK
jgi:sodium transport system permease protein